MNGTALVLATLLWSVAVLPQNPPSVAGDKSECRTLSQTVLLTIETAATAPLSNTDVLVSVDKGPFAPVSRLQSASSAPLDLILVIDSSSSAVRSRLRSAALDEVPRLVAAIGGNGTTLRTGVVEFSTASRVVRDFTRDPIEGSFGLLSPGGGSALHDALALAAARLQEQSPASNRRVILAITDGEDNLSHTTREEVVQAAVRASAPILALSLGEPPTQYTQLAGRGVRFLKEVSAQTGGKVYFPKNATQVAEVLAAIRSEMQMQYFAVVAVPTSQKGLHQVQFKMSGRHEFVRGAAAVTCE